MSETNFSPDRTASRLPTPSFVPEAYSSDGGFSPGGLGLLLVLSGVSGALAGFLTSWISEWFYLVLLFPLLIGGVIGAIGKWAIKRGKVRNPLLGGLAGLIGGGTAVFMMHYSDFIRFRAELDKIDPEVQAIARRIPELKAQGDRLDPELKKLIGELDADPQLVRAIQVTDLGRYIDYMAEQGVTISNSHGVNDRGMNLGYVGSYIYWCVELLILVGVSFAMMRSASAEPFCAQCENWKKELILGSLSPSAEDAVEAINQGDFNRLHGLQPTSASGELQVSVAVCPNCTRGAAIDVKLDHLSHNGKGELKTKRLTRVTYPGDVLPALQEMFAAPQEPFSKPTPQ